MDFLVTNPDFAFYLAVVALLIGGAVIADIVRSRRVWRRMRQRDGLD